MESRVVALCVNLGQCDAAVLQIKPEARSADRRSRERGNVAKQNAVVRLPRRVGSVASFET